MKRPAVYIVANKRNGTIYVGVTSHLERRIYEHREGVLSGFSRRYGGKFLVWYEMHETMEYAISREKQLKAGSRQRKIDLIQEMNPDWRDLYEDLI
ncbi:MAG: GIY-YIG nuclease family protein [Parvibaculum sp.]|nr:GIY-YIG nuclease family protein [Parvibaculum sp.]